MLFLSTVSVIRYYVLSCTSMKDNIGYSNDSIEDFSKVFFFFEFSINKFNTKDIRITEEVVEMQLTKTKLNTMANQNALHK